MPDTHLVFDLSKENDLHLDGFSNLKILFTPNKGMVPVALENSASGGELSRLMLSIQYLLSTKKELPTLILDEIDTGVSGDVAQKIGSLLAKMGKEMQLFAITHLPQVAGKGKTHLKVIKDALSGVTTTQVLSLSEEERVEEVARLMSGDAINASAIAHAKALMEN
jgi:DNA repair protein RecN (Recombination protein N)